MNGNISKKTITTYIIFSIIIGLFLIVLYIYDLKTDTRQQQSPYSVSEWTDYEKEFRMKKTVISGNIRVNGSVGDILAFYSVHQNVKIYSSSKLIYEYPVKNNNPFSSSPGYCWNFVPLPYASNDLEITITSPYQPYLKNVPKFYIGNAFSLPSYIIGKDFVPFALCIIMFIVGLVLIVYHLVMARNIRTNGKLAKLGIFAAFLSIWSINECTLTTFILKNNLVTSYLSFLALMALSLPFAVFVKTFYEDDSKLWGWFCQANMIQIIACLLLAVSGLADLRKTLWTTHVILCALVVIIIVRSFTLARNKANSHMVKIHLACLLVCAISLIADLVGFYFNIGDGNSFGRLGFLTYIVVLGIASTKESVTLMKMGQEADAYQTLAYTDQMTGLNNRTCFNVDFEKYSENPHDIAVIDFDLNNLKYANDTFGHSVGDAYIKSCATIIYEIFNGLGKCYRVGGDEFVALIENASAIDMTHYMAMLESSVDACNRDSKLRQLKMQIAYGYAIYSPDLDKNLEDTYNRADKIMYSNKKEKKEQRKFERA